MWKCHYCSVADQKVAMVFRYSMSAVFDGSLGSSDIFVMYVFLISMIYSLTMYAELLLLWYEMNLFWFLCYNACLSKADACSLQVTGIHKVLLAGFRFFMNVDD